MATTQLISSDTVQVQRGGSSGRSDFDDDSVIVRTIFETESPALVGRILKNEFAGVGPDDRSATLDGFTKFLLGPFHVILSALGKHECSHGSEEWREYAGIGAGNWRVCDSALVTQGFDDPASVPFAPIQQEITAAFLREGSLRTHWVEVFFGFLNGERTAAEVDLDGQPWPTGIQILQCWEFTPDAGYKSGRYFFLALRSDT